MKRHEWRVLPLTSYLSDRWGELVFVWAHIPLLVLVFWIVSQGATSPAAIGLSGFAILHIGLHWVFRKHPKNEFNNWVSWALILLPGGFASG